MEDAHRRRCDAAGDEEPGVRADDARVRRAGALDPLTGEAVIGERALDAEKVVRRPSAGGFDQEPRLPGAELDLERRAAAEE